MKHSNPPKQEIPSLKRNFAYQSGYQLLLIIIPLVTTPYLSRVLGAEGVGVFSVTQAIASYFVMFSMLGMSTYGVREIAATKTRKERSRTFWSAYASQLCTSLPCLVIYCFAIMLTCMPGGFAVSLAWGMYVLSAVIDISWLLFGVEEFRIPTIRSIITKLATLIVIFGFVRGPEDTWIYCAAIAGSFLANQLAIWPFVHRYVDWERPSWNDVAKHIKPNATLFIPVIAISLYTAMDKLLLGGLAGMEQAGFFEYSEKLSRMPMAVITAMGTVMLPRMTANLTLGKREEAIALLDESIWIMLAMAFALAFGIASIAPEFATIFLGEEFASCYSVMTVLAVIIPIVSITNVIGRQYLIPTGRDFHFTISVCIGAVVNVAVNLLLIPILGAMGAAIATVIAEFTILVVQSIEVRHELPLIQYARNALPFAAIGMFMAVCVRLIASHLNAIWGMSILGLAIEVTVGCAVFLMLAAIWCIAIKDTHFKKLLGRKT